MAKVLALALVLVAMAAVEAQFPPPPGSSSTPCTAALASLAPCLNYLVGPSVPTMSCCNAVTSIANQSSICLCPLFTTNMTANLLGFPVNNIPLPLNQARAVNLPGACRVSTPLLSQCKLSPASSPAVAPNSAHSSPAAAPKPAHSSHAAAPKSAHSSHAAAPKAAHSSPGPALKVMAQSPASSVDSPALAPATDGGVISPAKAPATSGGVLSPSGNPVKPTGSASDGSMVTFSLSSMFIVGLINIMIASIIFV